MREIIAGFLMVPAVLLLFVALATLLTSPEYRDHTPEEIEKANVKHILKIAGWLVLACIFGIVSALI